MQRSRTDGKYILARTGQQLKLDRVPEKAILSAYASSRTHGFRGTTAVLVLVSGCMGVFMGLIP